MCTVEIIKGAYLMYIEKPKVRLFIDLVNMFYNIPD